MDFNPNDQNRYIRRYLPGKGVTSVQSLDPHLVGLGKAYFGIDLERLPEMTDEEWANFADRAQQMKRLREALPILKKHFDELIQGQIEYEDFITNVQKDFSKGAQKIDKNILDIYLLSQGYQKHFALMGQKASNGLAKLDAEHNSAVHLELLDFSTALEIIALKYERQAAAIENKIPQMEQREELAQQQREERQYRKDLLTYGNDAMRKQGRSQGGGSWWQNFADWFTGR